MTKQRDIRRLAMQILYQIDLRGPDDLEWIRLGLAEGPDPADVQRLAFDLAAATWDQRSDADALATRIAPQWPAHRQPAVDRALLRLGYHEIASGRTPPRVVINEMIELAKKYSSQQGPAFINGVLDKIAAHLAADPTSPAPSELNEEINDCQGPPPAGDGPEPEGLPDDPTPALSAASNQP